MEALNWMTIGNNFSHPAEPSSPSDTAVSLSIVGVATSLAGFQTWTSLSSKSCNCFMEVEHTNKKHCPIHSKDHNPNYSKFHPQFISSISSLTVTVVT
jgi:redox-sensitive bicupin YhaK (pirin superfamily)